MSERVTLVTGGASGIGEATAIRIAKAGEVVLIADIDDDRGEEVVSACNAEGGEAAFIHTDVTSESDAEAAVSFAMDEFGRLDAAVNSAGGSPHRSPFVDDTPEWYDRVMDLNVRSTWIGMRLQIPALIGSGGGSVVNLSSVMGLVGAPGRSLYSASKHAVLGLTKCAANEYGGDRVRVNAVCPGTIETPLVANLAFEMFPDLPEDEARTAFEKLAEGVALQRFGQADEVADAIFWLCSEDSSYVTGTQLVVDGGYTSR